MLASHYGFGYGPKNSQEFKNLDKQDDADSLIHIDLEYEVRDYSVLWGVTPDQLKEAVQRVGSRCCDVERLLRAR